MATDEYLKECKKRMKEIETMFPKNEYSDYIRGVVFSLSMPPQYYWATDKKEESMNDIQIGDIDLSPYSEYLAPMIDPNVITIKRYMPPSTFKKLSDMLKPYGYEYQKIEKVFVKVDVQ
jgi:hypothetical protein